MRHFKAKNADMFQIQSKSDKGKNFFIEVLPVNIFLLWIFFSFDLFFNFFYMELLDKFFFEFGFQLRNLRNLEILGQLLETHIFSLKVVLLFLTIKHWFHHFFLDYVCYEFENFGSGHYFLSFLYGYQGHYEYQKYGFFFVFFEQIFHNTLR